MSRRINFFATEKDMVSLLKEVEETIPFDVKYILSYDTSIVTEKVLEYKNVEQIPNLGRLTKHHSEKSFLITRSDMKSKVKKTPIGVKVIQGENPESVGFDPSGFSEDGSCLIHGIFSTMEEVGLSKELFNAIRRLMNKHFTKVRGWYFGDEAKSLCGQVRYICIGVNEPEEYDFHPEF